MKNRKGEVVTLLTIGALVVIGVTAIVTSLSPSQDQKKTTSTRAAITCPDEFTRCGYGTSADCCDPSTQKCSLGKCVALASTDCGGPESCTGNSNKYYTKSGVHYSDKLCSSTKQIDDITTYCAPPTTGCDGPKTCATSTNKYWKKSGAYYSSAGCTGTAVSLTTVCPPPKPDPTTPIVGTCEKGEYFEGEAGSWGSSTPEQICAANNGTYIAKTQKQVGDKRAVCCAVGNVNSQCPQVGLGYACCVQDNRCAGDTNRYRWYGCTGQVCSATKINTRGGPGHLVDCPVGVTKANPEKCEQDLTPAKPSEDCTDNGSYGLLGGCKEKCTANGYECLASPNDTSGEKRFCCKAPDPITPNNCTTKNPSSTHTYACISSGEDANEACSSQTGTMAGSVYDAELSCGEGTKVCCKKAKDPDGGTAGQCNSKATITCPGKTTQMSYYKSKTTPKCEGKEIDDTCYGTSSTSCESYTWKQIVANGCDGAALPPDGGEVTEGTIQTNAASEIIENGARLNGSYNGAFKTVGFTLNGKKYPAGTTSPFSYLITGLTPNTSYSYNTYGVIDGKEKSGTSVTFKTTTAAYNPKNADYERLGTIKVSITLANVGQRNISEERARFKMNVGNALNRCDNKEFVLKGNVLTSDCATLERFDLQKTQSPTYVDVWYIGRAGIDTQALYHGTETFIADQFEKSIALTYDFGTITKNFSINISTTCTSLLIPSGGISIKGVVGGMPKTDQKITPDAPYSYNGIVDSTKELNTLVISGATCESSKGTGLSFLADKEYTKTNGAGNNFVAIVNE